MATYNVETTAGGVSLVTPAPVGVQTANPPVTLDTTPPTITLTSPGAGSTFASPWTPVVFTVSDNIGLAYVLVLVKYASWPMPLVAYDGALEWPFTVRSSVSGTTTLSFSLLPALGWQEDATVTVVAVDTGGNKTTATWTFYPSAIGAYYAASSPALATAQAEVTGEDLLFTDDFQLTADGDYVSVTGDLLVRQMVYNRLLTVPGEYKLHPDYGVGLPKWVKRTASAADLAELKQRIIEQLTEDSAVEQVVGVDVQWVTYGTQLVLRVTVTVKVLTRTIALEPFDFAETLDAAF